MAITIQRKENENIGTFLFRFNKKVKQAGVVKEIKRRRFVRRTASKRARRVVALYRSSKRKELEQLKKYGATTH